MGVSRTPQRGLNVEAALRHAGVRLAVRAGVVRLSPHAYSTEEEIQQAIEAIPA